MGKEKAFSPESFLLLHEVQLRLERRGYHFCPVPKEHTEGLITKPLRHRLRTLIKKRGFANVAGRVFLTFSGHVDDPREIFEIPEVRAYWRRLDRALPELPALLGMAPEFAYNGPGLHLACLGTVDRVTPPEPAFPLPRFHMHVAEGRALADQALASIRQAGEKYHLPASATERIVTTFLSGIGPAA